MRLRPVVLSFLVAAACGAPEAPQPAFAANQPPRIVPASVQPAARRVVTGNQAGCSLEFSADIVEPEGDAVRWRIYFDNLTVLFASGTGSGGVTQNVKATFRWEDPGMPIFTQGLHVVELVVSDTELDSTGESWPKGRTPDGGVNFGYSDSKVWIVETAAQSCP